MKRIVVILCVALFSTAANSMGDGVVNSPSSSLEPRYVTLAEGQELFCGRVYDEKVVVEMRELSFSGHATIDGLRREDDDSLTMINIADYKEIIIEQQIYQSKRYSDKEFTLISLVSKQDKISKGYLAPRNLVVCGIEKDTNAEKAWFLKKVDRIVIERNNVGVSKPTDYVNKIFKSTPEKEEQTDQPAQQNKSIPPKSSDQKEQAPTVNLLDQTMTSTVPSNSLAAAGIVEVEGPVQNVQLEQKTVWQSVTSIANSIADLIKAIFRVIKKMFRWL